MEVILLKDVKPLGKSGDLVEAKTGYARNYLLPRGLAVEATKENKKKWKEEMKNLEAKRQKEEEEALELKEKIEKITVEIETKGGEGGRLFGSITSNDIADALKSQHKINLDRRKIQLKDNIKTTGITNVDVRIYPEITASLKVDISIE
ncbi:MAG TPA: 50S ribosomal protein L9 [Tissierellaceae bacterium]|nr:50S ribosomal protein L9 [Tissierellaceae bacterium]